MIEIWTISHVHCMSISFVDVPLFSCFVSHEGTTSVGINIWQLDKGIILWLIATRIIIQSKWKAVIFDSHFYILIRVSWISNCLLVIYLTVDLLLDPPLRKWSCMIRLCWPGSLLGSTATMLKRGCLSYWIIYFSNVLKQY